MIHHNAFPLYATPLSSQRNILSLPWASPMLCQNLFWGTGGKPRANWGGAGGVAGGGEEKAQLNEQGSFHLRSDIAECNPKCKNSLKIFFIHDTHWLAINHSRYLHLIYFIGLL